MNGKQARDFIAKYPNAKSFVKPSHLEELSPLLEVHVEAIEVRKDEFHELEGGKTHMPRKETLDKFASAAGVSYNAASESTRKEGDGCYVGRSQGMVMGPDGKMILGDVCEYEFDIDVRLEEMKLKGKADWDHKIGNRPGTRAYTETELAQERIQLAKVARQRANTGARNRATVAILGMQTGFKNLFSKDDRDDATRTFLFSRIIINAKNELVMNRMLDNLGPATAMLYGSQAPAQIAAPAATEPEFRTVGPGHDDEAVATPPQAGTAFDFDAPAAGPGDNLRASLAEWANASGMPETVAAAINAVLDRDEKRPEILEPMLALVKLVGDRKLGQKGIGTVERVLLDTNMTANTLQDFLKAANQAASVAGAA